MSRDALVVGINTYDRTSLNNLQAPAEDAEAIARLLTEYGEFTAKRLPEIKNQEDNQEKYPLRVGRKTKVTRKDLKEALIQLFTPEGNHIPDTALFYFSGHGLRETSGRLQEGYLATSDANPDEDNYGLSLQWLRRLLQESPIRQQIVWLDCCYSGELLNFAEADPGDKGKGRDRCFIAASREFEAAYEETIGSHGVLTKALLQGLDPRRNLDRWLTNYTLVDFLDRELRSAAQRPIFTNFGEPINLTRQWQVSTETVPTSPSDICPYKGLEYFDCNDEDPKYFYGREKLTNQLLDRVRQENFLAVLGASGSGKSSVLRAGLLYQLKQGRHLSGSNQWQIYIMQPGEHPLQSLARVLVNPELSAVERAKQLGDAEALVAQGATGLRRLVQSAPSRVVLVLDQFEEVFTLCQNLAERQQFFQCLLGALELTDRQLCLILAMRADFFGKCIEQEYSGLAKQIQQHLVTVTPMNSEELEKAIVEPAKRVELAIEPELVRQMLADVANAPGSLPLLQYTLTELWKQRQDNCLRLNTYAKLGGVMGTLRQRATAVYNSFTSEQQAATQHIFLALTQLGEGTEDTRRRVLKPDLVNERYPESLIDEVVQRLADEKLIVTSEMVEKGGASGRVAVVDVAHEALIRHWDLLRKWIDENWEKLRQKRKIEAAAEEWREKRKARDYLLGGKPLTDAKAFQKEQAGSLSLSNLAKDFIQSSIKQRRNNRRKFVGFNMIIPLGLAVFLGLVAAREIKIRQLRATVDAAKGQKESLARIVAFQELVDLGASLTSIDLYRAKLEGADLYRAKLEGAILEGAILKGANLEGANLEGANLEGAELYYANLGGAKLEGADLYRANLEDANLEGAELYYANLGGANLEGAILKGAILKGAILAGTNLAGTNLAGTNLAGAILKRATLGCIQLPAEKRCTDFRGVANLTPTQVKSARNWQQAIYDKEFRKQLGLPPEK